MAGIPVGGTGVKRFAHDSRIRYRSLPQAGRRRRAEPPPSAGDSASVLTAIEGGVNSDWRPRKSLQRQTRGNECQPQPRFLAGRSIDSARVPGTGHPPEPLRSRVRPTDLRASIPLGPNSWRRGWADTSPGRRPPSTEEHYSLCEPPDGGSHGGLHRCRGRRPEDADESRRRPARTPNGAGRRDAGDRSQEGVGPAESRPATTPPSKPRSQHPPTKRSFLTSTRSPPAPGPQTSPAGACLDQECESRPDYAWTETPLRLIHRTAWRGRAGSAGASAGSG